MKVGVYLDMTGELLLVSHCRFVWYEHLGCGDYKNGFEIEYRGVTDFWDNSTQITFVLRDCVYLGKI